MNAYTGCKAKAARSCLFLLAVGLGATLLGAAALAQSLMSEEEVRQVIEERYGVEILRIEEAESDGIPVFVLRAMNPAGNYNEAFQVNKIVVNRRNGQLLPQFRHRNSGVADTAGARRQVIENSDRVLRERSLP